MIKLKILSIEFCKDRSMLSVLNILNQQTQKKMAFAMAKDLIKRTSTTIEPYIQTVSIK